jgi:hypothetical protein
LNVPFEVLAIFGDSIEVNELLPPKLAVQRGLE